MESNFDAFEMQQSIIFFIERAISAPDGSSPRGYSRIFVFEYRLKHSCMSGGFISANISLILYLFIGCAFSAPDGSNSEAMMGCSQPIIGSKLSFL
jgi:hypothetical protein